MICLSHSMRSQVGITPLNPPERGDRGGFMKTHPFSAGLVTRRDFMGVAGLLGMDFLLGTPVYRLYRRLVSILRGREMPLPEGERKDYVLPQGGERVSVETALNSRCTSDEDGDSHLFHWGMFDPERKLTEGQIRGILGWARIPRFTRAKLGIRADGPLLTFLVGQEPGQDPGAGAMVESGMQQQMVGLLCAAMGVSMVFKGMGDNGTVLSPNELATVGMRLGAMRPSYEGSYWISSPPRGPRPWRKGSLSEPDRKGHTPLLSVVPSLKISCTTLAGEAGAESASQLLWASRGRTPHFYKGRPWGMTLPVSRGDQEVTALYLLSEGSLYRYVNWAKGRPTHDLKRVRSLGPRSWTQVCSDLGIRSHALVWCRNEETGRAFWEVGYQLTNTLLQAASMGCGYRAFLLQDKGRDRLQGAGASEAVACMALG